MGRNHIFLHCHECRNHGRCRKERTFSGTCYVPGCIIEDTRDANAVSEIKKITTPKQETTMHLIGFSHHYTKLHYQRYATLCYVEKVIINDEFSPKEGLEYDSEWINSKGEKCYFKLPNGRYLRLLFIGDLDIPFTTYRKIPDTYKFLSGHESAEHLHKVVLPYSDLIGSLFALKFKGEKLSTLATKNINDKSVKIFD